MTDYFSDFPPESNQCFVVGMNDEHRVTSFEQFTGLPIVPELILEHSQFDTSEYVVMFVHDDFQPDEIIPGEVIDFMNELNNDLMSRGYWLQDVFLTVPEKTVDCFDIVSMYQLGALHDEREDFLSVLEQILQPGMN
jgi:hypothetical protein